MLSISQATLYEFIKVLVLWKTLPATNEYLSPAGPNVAPHVCHHVIYSAASPGPYLPTSYSSHPQANSYITLLFAALLLTIPGRTTCLTSFSLSLHLYNILPNIFVELCLT